MALYRHPLFTIDLNKIISVNLSDDESAVTIRTDDQRKIEVAADSPEAALELLNDLASRWEKATGPVLRHANHVFLSAAIYSLQIEESEVYIYLRDHSVSFAAQTPDEALQLLAELTRRWQAAIGGESTS